MTRACYYDPRTGRFLSEDPIGIKSKDYNIYRYVSNNPLRYSDPTGKFLPALAWGIAVGLFISDLFSGDQGSINSTPGKRDDRPIDMAIPGDSKYEKLERERDNRKKLEFIEDKPEHRRSCLSS